MKRLVVALVSLSSALLLGGAPAQAMEAGTPMDITLVTPNNSFADPGLLITPTGSPYNRYYLYATGGWIVRDSSGAPSLGMHFKSSNTMDAFGSNRTAWIKPSAWRKWWVDTDRPDLWAPHVFFNGSQYVVWYTAKRNTTRLQRCIGAAYSSKPAGPFTALQAPLYCESGRQVIDAAMLQVRGGNRWLVAKSYCCDLHRNNAAGDYLHDSRIFARMVRPGGLFLEPDKSTIVLKEYLDSPTIEAPSLVESGGRVWLFVSRNSYKKCTYKTQVFSADHIRAKFTLNQSTLPVRNRAGTDLCGDGGLEVAWDPFTKVWRAAFHAFVGGTSGTRRTYTGCVGFLAAGPAMRTCP